MTFEVRQVQPSLYDATYPFFADLVQAIMEQTQGLYTTERLSQQVKSGEVEMWVLVQVDEAQPSIRAILGKSIYTAPTGERVQKVLFFHGKPKISDWGNYLVAAMERDGLRRGVSRFIVASSKAMSRKGMPLHDYNVTHWVYERRFTQAQAAEMLEEEPANVS